MKTDGLFIQKLVVGYNGKKYAANPISIFNVFNEYDLTNITINTIPSVIHEVTDMEEDENTIKLKFGEIIFDLDEEENPSFKTNFKKEIIFDKTTQRGIGDKLNARIDRMSYGQQQRVALIRALCQPYDFILLDEPISHLDDKNSDIMRDIVMREAKASGAAVIATSIGKHMNIDYDKILRL